MMLPRRVFLMNVFWVCIVFSISLYLTNITSRLNNKALLINKCYVFTIMSKSYYIQYKINILDVSVFNNCKFNVMALSILFHWIKLIMHTLKYFCRVKKDWIVKLCFYFGMFQFHDSWLIVIRDLILYFPLNKVFCKYSAWFTNAMVLWVVCWCVH